MKSKQALVPKLRFGEFGGGWTPKKIEDFAPLQRGFDLPTTQVKEGDYPVVYSNGILRRHHKYMAKGNGVVTGRSGTIGKVTYVEDKYWPHNTTLWVTCFNSSVPKYVYYYFISLDLSKFKAGGAVPTLNRNDVHRHKTALPSLPEQEKIAAFLTSVDDRIDQLKRKKSLLQDYKKGVMQKLFAQELRFKDDNGKPYPDWDEKKLGEVSHNVGYGLNASAVKFDGIHKYIRITDIDEDSRSFAPKPMTSPESYNDDYLLKDGDLVFARTGASVGKSYLHTVKNDQVYFAGFLIRFSINRSIAYPAFIFMQTLTQNYAKWVKVMSMRSGQPGINAEEYKSFSIPLPTLPEQTKIANFLSTLDQKIEQIDTQITQTQTFKKGLLQQMFV